MTQEQVHPGLLPCLQRSRLELAGKAEAVMPQANPLTVLCLQRSMLSVIRS